MAQEKVWNSPVDSASRKVILLVEDEAANALCLADIISQNTPYHVFETTNSFGALHFVRYIKPHLFILDYRLPGMNGIELYDHLHANKELVAIPAIILTPCWEQCLDEIETRKLIAFQKPFDLDDFLYAVKEMLGWSSDYSNQ